MWYLGLGSAYSDNYEALIWLYYEAIVWKIQFFSVKSAEAMKIEKLGVSCCKYAAYSIKICLYSECFGIVFAMPWGVPKNAYYPGKYRHKSINL